MKKSEYEIKVTGTTGNWTFGTVRRAVGESVGVKIGGGILQQVLRTIDIDCLPTDIPEKFDLDISQLGLDQTMFVRDLNLGDKYTIVTRGELAVAVVKAPADAPAAPGSNPEVIKKGKDEAKK